MVSIAIPYFCDTRLRALLSPRQEDQSYTKKRTEFHCIHACSISVKTKLLPRFFYVSEQG